MNEVEIRVVVKNDTDIGMAGVLRSVGKARAEVRLLKRDMDGIDTKARASIESRLRGAVGGGSSGGGGGFGGAARGGAAGGGGIAGSFAGSGILSGLAALGPVGGTAAVAAALAALPFIASAAASGVVIALGGGLSALGVIAAAKLPVVAKQFGFLEKTWKHTVDQMRLPWKNVLVQILADAETSLAKLGPSLTKFSKLAAPSFGGFTDSLVKTFGGPAMQTAILSLGKAFSLLFKDLTPQAPGIVNALANGINGMAKAFTDHPNFAKGMADVIAFLLRLPGYALGALGSLTRVANWMITGLPHDVSIGLDRTRTDIVHWALNVNHTFDDVRHTVSSIWDILWSNTIGRTIRGVHDVDTWDNNLRHNIANTYDGIRHDVASAWDLIWRNTITRVQNGIHDVNSWFHRMPGQIMNALSGLGHTLWQYGSFVLGQFWAGLKSIAGGIVNWLKNFAGGLAKTVMHILGIHSPSSVFYGIGKNMMLGLEKGVKDHVGKATSAVSFRGVGSAGSGVQRWAGLVRQALRMEGLSPALLGNVLYQMQTESGGNPNAINLWDVNARNGDPSRGLMQTIAETFSAYHWPGTSFDIFNPLANIAAALNYARNRYGPGLMSGGMGIGSGHGYARGTGHARPGWAWVGELGPELVNFRGGESVMPMGRGRGVTSHVTLHLRGTSGKLDQMFINWLRDAVLTQGGGDVQAAFGAAHY
jgi:Transglycosylase SLT domain